MTNFARLSNTLQGMWEGKQEYLDSLNRFPLLILDDLGAERKSEYMNEIVFNLIDSRYRAKLPLIVTTNLTSEELKNPADITNRRTYSRLLEMCIPLEVKGEDRRREKLKDSFKEMKELLGI
jgi:DNA replication protein DnaC